MPNPYKQFVVPPEEIFHTHASRLHPAEKRLAERYGFPRMKDVYWITVGDWYGHKPVAPGDIDRALAVQAARGMQAIVWRTVFRDHKARWFHQRDRSIYDAVRHKDYYGYITNYLDNIEQAFAGGEDPNRIAVELIHDYGMQAWHWGDGLFDNRGPVWQRYGGQAPCRTEAKLQIEKPWICRQDRFGHPHYGVWEYRYPEARAFTVARLVEEIQAYDFDGMFLSTRTHSVPALDGDQYGYNDVIEDELVQRSGISFRDPDYRRRPDAQETRRRILGESVTLLLRDLRAAWPRDKKLFIAIPRTDYWGPPYGNVFIDWRTWLKENLVDGLAIGELSGKFLYRRVIADHEYRNHLSDEEAGVGLRPYFYDLEYIYGPACAAAGAELFVILDSKSMQQECWGTQRLPKLESGQQPD